MAKAKRAPTRRKRSTRNTKRKKAKQKPPERNGRVKPNGTIIVHDIEGNPVELDAAIVMMIAEPLEIKHRLDDTNEEIKPTPAFVKDLSKQLQRQDYDTTPTTATDAWICARAYYAELQKKTN